MTRHQQALMTAALAAAGCFQSQDTAEYLSPCKFESGKGIVICEVGSGAHRITLGPEFNLPQLAGLELAYDAGQFAPGLLLEFGEELPEGGSSPPPSNGTAYVDIGCPSVSIRPDGALGQDIPVRLTLSAGSCKDAPDFDLQPSDCGRLSLFRWNPGTTRWEPATEISHAGDGTFCRSAFLSGDTVLGDTANGDYYKIFIATPPDFDTEASLSLTMDTPLTCVDPVTLEAAACDSGAMTLLSYASSLEDLMEGGSHSKYPLGTSAFEIEYLGADGSTVEDKVGISRLSDGSWSHPGGLTLVPDEFQAFRIRLRNIWGGERAWPPEGPARVRYVAVPKFAPGLGGLGDAVALKLSPLLDEELNRLDTSPGTWTYYLPGPIRPQSTILSLDFGTAFPILATARFYFYQSGSPEAYCAFDRSGVKSSECDLDSSLFPNPPQFFPASGRMDSLPLLDTEGLGPRRYAYQLELTDSFGKRRYPASPAELEVRTPVISIEDHQIPLGEGPYQLPVYFYYDPDVFVQGSDRYGGSISFNLQGWDNRLFCPDSPNYLSPAGLAQAGIRKGPNSPTNCIASTRLELEITANKPEELVAAASPLELGRLNIDVMDSSPLTTRLIASDPVLIGDWDPATPVSIRVGVLTTDVRDSRPPSVSPPDGVCGVPSPDFDAACISVEFPNPRVCFAVEDPQPSSGIETLFFQRRIGDGPIVGDGTGIIRNTDPNVNQLIFDNCNTNEPLSENACVALALDPDRPGEVQSFFPQVKDFKGESYIATEPWVSFCYNPPGDVTIPVGLDDTLTQEACSDSSRYCSGEGSCAVNTDQICRCFAASPNAQSSAPYLMEFRLYRDGEGLPFLVTREAPTGNRACFESEGEVDPLNAGAYRLDALAVANSQVGVVSTPAPWFFTVPEFDLPDPIVYGPPPVFPLDIQDQFHVCRLTGTVAGTCPFDAGQMAIDLRFQSDLGPDDPVNPVAGYRARWAGPNAAPEFLESDFRDLPGEGTEQQLLILRSPEGTYGHYRVEVEGYLRKLTGRENLPKTVLDFAIVPPQGAISTDTVIPQGRIIRMPSGPLTLSPKNNSVTFYIGYDGGMPLDEVAYRFRLLRPGSLSSAWSSVVRLQDFNFITQSLCEPGFYLFQVRAYNTSVAGLPEDQRSDLSPPGAVLEVRVPEGVQLCGN